MTSDVRGQIKFLEELDKAEQKRHEEAEREILLRAAKSRSKTEDPEQAKLKAKVNLKDFLLENSLKNNLKLQAKEMQRAEMEELRHREANNTALQAIGPRKKLKLDPDSGAVAVSLKLQCFPLHILKIFFPDCNGRQRWNTSRQQSNCTAPTTHQASQHARHDILHGAGEGQLSQQHVV